jgi:excinuclease UvrABC helicase subunit UvrB
MTNCQDIAFGILIAYDRPNQKTHKMRKKRLFEDLDSLVNSLFNNEFDPFVMRGRTNNETGNDDNGNWSKETFTSEDGMIQFTTIFRNNNGQHPSQNNSDINKLKKLLLKAIDEQEFEMAVELRDRIKSLEENKDKIAALENDLKEAINKQDFEKAIEIRDELKKLK